MTHYTIMFSEPAMHTPLIFKLPIHYVPHHALSATVAEDLELVERNVADESVSKGKTMYDVLLEPSHIFAKETAKLWSTSFTSDVEFLESTQEVIREHEQLPLCTLFDAPNLVKTAWSSIQDDNDFLDRLGFLEWDCLKSLNESSSFLQWFTFIQILSPIVSLLMPFFILFFPFLLMSCQGQCITFETYLQCLKNVAKSHFIGKMLNIKELNAQNIVYLIISIVFYFFSTYQNVMTSIKFYNNLKTMSQNLLLFKRHLRSICPRMKAFIDLHKNKPKYAEFCHVSLKQYERLTGLLAQLDEWVADDATISFAKLSVLGEMLKIYYTLYSSPAIIECMEYSFGFEGYLDNLRALSQHVRTETLAFSQFSADKPTLFKDQYYPSLIHSEPVKNDVVFKKNIIVTGPNASGKTTLLKTTMLNVIFSQQVGCGFYSSATIRPYQHMHSYLNIPDTSDRDSLFQAESRRCKEILECCQTEREGRHLCIFDELFSGTNYKDAIKSSISFLKYLAKQENVDFALTTHYTAVCSQLKMNKRIGLFKMDARLSEKDANVLEYTYKMKKGISRIEGGIYILKDMNFPDEIIDGIREQ